MDGSTHPTPHLIRHLGADPITAGLLRSIDEYRSAPSSTASVPAHANTTEARPVVDSVARVLADDELMDAIDLGEESWFWPVGGEVADVGDVLRDLRATRAEVRRLRDEVAELEALRSADIAVIGKLSAAVATTVPLAELQARYLTARQHTLSTAGLPYEDAVIDQAAYVTDEARELQAAAEDLANDGAVGDATGRTLTTAELLTATRHEIADVVLAVITLANILGVTVEACIAEKTEHDQGRG